MIHKTILYTNIAANIGLTTVWHKTLAVENFGKYGGSCAIHKVVSTNNFILADLLYQVINLPMFFSTKCL